jgi:GT2 family glycosyltransferase
MYGEDLQYAWRIRKLGFASYLVARPIIFDIDMTFPGSHIYGLFDPTTPLYKVYLRMRNSVIISRNNTYQNKVSLFINIVVWMTGLLLLGLFKFGPTKSYFERVGVIYNAVKDGYKPGSPLPSNVKLPM